MQFPSQLENATCYRQRTLKIGAEGVQGHDNRWSLQKRDNINAIDVFFYICIAFYAFCNCSCHIG